jgi:uncharacterized membrane protein YhhN
VVAGLAVATGLAVVLLLLAERGDGPWRRPVKAAASTGFIAVAIAAGAFDAGYGRIVLAALVLAWVGDLLLTYSSAAAFLGGLVAFLLGHVLYVLAFGVRGIEWVPVAAASVLLAVIGVIVWRWLSRHVEAGMRLPVLAYIVVISAMVAAAVGTHAATADMRIVAGAVAFFASDLAVARNRFVAPGWVNRLWGLPLYYGGQLLLALSVGA